MGSRNSGTIDQEKETAVFWMDAGMDGGVKTSKCNVTWTCRGKRTQREVEEDLKCRGKEKQRETEEDLDGQSQRRPEREKYRLDQDWSSDQKQ